MAHTDSISAEDLIGVWKRQSLQIEGGEPFEVSHAYWLQAHGFYADMRWPRGEDHRAENSAFAGTADWQAPWMRFAHEIDFNSLITEDVGHLSRENNGLRERGELQLGPKTIKFEELWRPVRPKTDNGFVDTSVNVAQLAIDADNRQKGYLVRIADHAIAMLETGPGVFSAGCWRGESASHWQLLAAIGNHEPLELVLQAVVSGPVVDGWRTLI